LDCANSIQNHVPLCSTEAKLQLTEINAEEKKWEWVFGFGKRHPKPILTARDKNFFSLSRSLVGKYKSKVIRLPPDERDVLLYLLAIQKLLLFPFAKLPNSFQRLWFAVGIGVLGRKARVMLLPRAALSSQ
jgi:hypothetical protein